MTKQRKKRCLFNIERDIGLLLAALCANPWQTGAEKWQDVVRTMEVEYQTSMTTRTVSGRINLLRESFKKQQLRCKTGTEEQKTERGRLISQIETIISDASLEINVLLNADTDDVIDDDVASDTDQQKQSSDESHQTHEAESTFQLENAERVPKSAKRKSRSTCPKSVKRLRIAETEKANLERKKYLDEADDTGSRKSKSRLSVEDQMIILKRCEHEIEIEMDKQRLALDKERLEIDKRRELRTEEESRRRDELHMSQMLLQQSMLILVNKVLYNGSV